jgi:SAM-dependent methyltransferase
VYDSQTPQYRRAFQVFLDHTDQKDTARAWPDRQVRAVPQRRVFIDAGAGTGKVTAWYTDQFQQAIAVEPNPSLCRELRHTCPTAQILPQMILAARPAERGDLVLCSHVFYYIARTEWLRTLEQLVSWIAPQGVLVAVLQNHETACMRMLDHFFGQRFSLSELVTAFRAVYDDHYRIDIETVPARVGTSDLESAYTVAEFILNLLPISRPPERRIVIEYVRQHFATSTGTFRLSCDQDFLRIQPRL